MSTSPSDWSRPYYKQPSGKPFVFYVVYGKFGEMPALSMSKYRSVGVPKGCHLSNYDSQQHAKALATFQDIHVWKEFQKRDASLGKDVSKSTQAMILQGEVDDCPTLNYLRDAIGLLTFLLDHGGIVIFDPQMFHWWPPDEWRARIFDPADSVPTHHVVILTSPEPASSLTWFHTRGMRKFGRPDLSVHHVPAQCHKAVIDMCNRFIEFQAFGGVIEEGQAIKMKTLPKGMICRHGGDLEDPDFNNVHVEITWPLDRH
jgi:hypothetical protein